MKREISTPPLGRFFIKRNYKHSPLFYKKKFFIKKVFIESFYKKKLGSFSPAIGFLLNKNDFRKLVNQNNKTTEAMGGCYRGIGSLHSAKQDIKMKGLENQ